MSALIESLYTRAATGERPLPSRLVLATRYWDIASEKPDFSDLPIHRMVSAQRPHLLTYPADYLLKIACFQCVQHIAQPAG